MKSLGNFESNSAWVSVMLAYVLLLHTSLSENLISVCVAIPRRMYAAKSKLGEEGKLIFWTQALVLNGEVASL